VHKRTKKTMYITLPPGPCFLGLLSLLGVVGAFRDFTDGIIVFPSFMSKSRQERL
jgi:hypothetical protein